ncbi:MAG TPA: hypothetical protein VGJ84_19150 [Polyangiaceae bacterium]
MRRSRAAGLALAGAALVVWLVSSIRADARVQVDSDYSKAQTYSAALRYLRVDLGYEVLEKDPDAAYVIFRYRAPDQPQNVSTGTVEIVEADDRVALIIQLPKLPEYYERVLRDGLLRILRAEYGAPRRARRTTPRPTDAGAG